MNSLQTISSKPSDFLIFVLAIQIITIITVVLDIPFARQVIGFLYLTFVPGIIFLKLLKLHNLDFAETILLSVGLSIAFLMFIGLLINELCPLIGILRPLSLGPLLIITSSIVLFMCFLSYMINKEDFNFASELKFSPLILPFVLLPFLSVAGTALVNRFQNNFLLLTMIIAISVLVVLSTLSKKLVPPKLYPLALLMIAIALLFHASLISNYILGNDIHSEYQLFKLTENNSHWDPTGPYANMQLDKLNAMLSITVLPSIYSSILNMEGTWIFKIIYPLVFSLVPLGIYQLYHTQVHKKGTFSKKAAFLSTFFFMANSTFFTEMLGLARQMVAELFYILLFFVLFSKKFNSLNKKICFVIFGAALIMSHYAVSYLFMFLIFLTWLIPFFLKYTMKNFKKSQSVTASLVLLFFIMSFSWYIYVSASGPFQAIVNIGNNVVKNFFPDFFNPEARGQGVLRGLGVTSAFQVSSFWHLIGRISAYATEFLIVIGFITLVIKRKKNAFDQEYFMLSVVNMAMLIMCIILPNVVRWLRMERFYHISLFFLAPLCILGGKNFFRFITNSKARVLGLVLIVLITFFLFQTEFVYEVTGDYSWSVPLSKYRMPLTIYSQGFVDEQDVFGAAWLTKNLYLKHNTLYGDHISRFHVLTSYGMINYLEIETLNNDTMVSADGIIYLGRMNVIHGIMFNYVLGYWNTTEISSILNNMNNIYSNGGCEIYKSIESPTMNMSNIGIAP